MQSYQFYTIYLNILVIKMSIDSTKKSHTNKEGMTVIFNLKKVIT